MNDLSWTSQAAVDVAKDIAAKIEGGVWQEGERLPPERVLARQYGLARNTIRRALDTLAGEGRLTRHVGRGTFVRAAKMLPTGDLARRLRDASPEDVMELRLVVEPETAALAAARASAADLREIEQAYRASILAKGVAEFEMWDSRLHLAVFRAARNPLLLDYCQAINAARNQPRWHKLKQRAVTPQTRDIYNRDHGDLVVALGERDAEAARQAMRHHLSVVRDHLLGIGH